MEIYAALIDKARFIGHILPAIQEFNKKITYLRFPEEAFPENESSIASDIRKMISDIKEMEGKLFDFFNRAELSDIDFDTALYEGIIDHNKYDKRRPFDPINELEDMIRGKNWEKDRIDEKLKVYESKLAEFKAAKIVEESAENK